MPDPAAKPKLLLVDHACHATTKSVHFLHDILADGFDLSLRYYDRHYRTGLTAADARAYDYQVYFEFLPGRFRLFRPGTRAVFIPMYDNEWGSVWCWRRIALTGMPVISFCGRVSDFARRQGVERLLDVRFFPDPARYPDMRGDPRILLLWERGNLTFETVKALFAPGDLKEVIVLRHPEERLTHRPISPEDCRDYGVRVIESGFMPRQQFLDTIRPAGTVLAPRRKEGIGMVFLEAMAMRKCVLAHRDATMDEYVRHGANGLLFDADRPTRVDRDALCGLHAALPDPAPYHARWLADKAKIVPFVRESPPLVLPLSRKLPYYAFAPLFAAETLAFRLGLRRTR